MIYLLVGHRGVGKTEFLKRLAPMYAERGMVPKTIDLDEEIALQEKMSVNEIFAQRGEDFFRQIEAKKLQELCEDHRSSTVPIWIALGAGFQGNIPSYTKVIWLRRRTDVAGRIFLDRPRLEAEIPPLDEYHARYLPRAARFRAWHHKQILLPEGPAEYDSVEPYLLGLKPAQMNASITVLPEYLANEIRLEDFITEKLLLGIRYFELREDLLTKNQIERLMSEIPKDQILVSFRTKDAASVPSKWWSQHKYDWAVELGPCPFGEKGIRSLHLRHPDETFSDAIERLMEQRGEHYKLAVPTHSVSELWLGHAWYMEDPQNRSFLPMSKDGRWLWYRSIINDRMHLNFVCDAEGSTFDQPSLYEWLAAQVSRPARLHTDLSFAAVLGDPVIPSRTPQEQGEFFRGHSMPVVKIQLREEEMHELTMSVLRRIGLQAAAVTAPLKKKAAQLCQRFEGRAGELQVVNTMWWDAREKAWVGANTDVDALENLLNRMSLPKSVGVWGGGAMRTTLMGILPQARFFSARQGEDVLGNVATFSPELLIWGVGRSRQKDCQWPSSEWKPLMVYDLNYTENSPGREYAMRVGASYVSGLGLFQLQAEMQRKFWSQRFLAEGKGAEL